MFSSSCPTWHKAPSSWSIAATSAPINAWGGIFLPDPILAYTEPLLTCSSDLFRENNISSTCIFSCTAVMADSNNSVNFSTFSLPPLYMRAWNHVSLKGKRPIIDKELITFLIVSPVASWAPIRNKMDISLMRGDSLSQLTRFHVQSTNGILIYISQNSLL